jgi:hypothetical protein
MAAEIAPRAAQIAVGPAAPGHAAILVSEIDKRRPLAAALYRSTSKAMDDHDDG